MNADTTPISVKGFAELPPGHRLADDSDIFTVNRIVLSAIRTWPVSDRLKRLVLPLLMYTKEDLFDYRIIIKTIGQTDVAVAAWEASPALLGLDASPSALLHGLYVHGAWQGLGIGAPLVCVVESQAARRGYGGLYVKAQRVAAGYFEGQGFTKVPRDERSYPHQFWRPLLRRQTQESAQQVGA